MTTLRRRGILLLACLAAATGLAASAATTAAAAGSNLSAGVIANGTPSPAPSARAGNGTGGGTAEGTADTPGGTECQGSTDPQVRVFGVIGASTAAGSTQPAPDARSRYAYGVMKPGSYVRDYVGFVNRSCFPVTLRIYPADAFNGGDGSVGYLDTTKKSRDLGSWITIGGSPTITVAARSTAIREFITSVPRNATPGDHLAAIMAASVPKASGSDGGVPSSQVITEYRVGMRVQVRVPGTLAPDLKIDGPVARYDQGGNPLWGGKATVTYTVRNTGNVSLKAPQQLNVRGLLSGTTAIPNLPEISELLPGGEAQYSSEVPNLFPLDRLTATVTLQPTDLEGKPAGLPTGTASASFWAVSIPLVLLLLVLLAGLVWYLRRRRTGGPRSRFDRSAANDTAADDESDDVSYVDLTDGRAAPLRMALPGVRPRLARLLRTSVVPVAGSVAAALLALLAVPAPAHADDAGTLQFVPGKTVPSVNLYVVTSGPCPAPTHFIQGYINGGEFPKDTLAIGTTDLPKTAGAQAFGFPLGDSVEALAQTNGVKLVPGEYVVSLVCRDDQLTKEFKRFNGTVTISKDLKHLTAPLPTEPPLDKVPAGLLLSVYPDNKAVQEAAAAQGLTLPGMSPAPEASQGPAVPGLGANPTPVDGIPQAAGAATTSASSTDGGGSTATVLGVVIVGVLSLWVLRGVSRRSPRQTSRFRDADPSDGDGEDDEDDEDDDLLYVGDSEESAR